MPRLTILKGTNRAVVKMKLYSAVIGNGRRNSFTVEASISDTLHDLLLYSVAAPSELTDEFLDKAVNELRAARETRIAVRAKEKVAYLEEQR
jgi:hypothetical protein